MAKLPAERLRWEKRPDMDPVNYDLQELPAGTQARPHLWSPSRRPQQAAILSVEQRALYAGSAGYLQRDQAVHEALLAFAGNSMRVGYVKDAYRLFGTEVTDEERRTTAKLPLGQEAVKVTMGLWVPDAEQFIVPDGVSQYGPMPISEIPASELLALPD